MPCGLKGLKEVISRDHHDQSIKWKYLDLFSFYIEVFVSTNYLYNHHYYLYCTTIHMYMCNKLRYISIIRVERISSCPNLSNSFDASSVFIYSFRSERTEVSDSRIGNVVTKYVDQFNLFFLCWFTFFYSFSGERQNQYLNRPGPLIVSPIFRPLPPPTPKSTVTKEKSNYRWCSF